MGRASVRSVDLILSTVRSLAYSKHTEGGTLRVNGFEESGGQAHLWVWMWEPSAFRATDRNRGCSICVWTYSPGFKPPGSRICY